MQRAAWKPPSEAHITEQMRLLGKTRAEVLSLLQEAARAEVWKNDIYQVSVTPDGEGGLALCIRRNDGGPILRDWRHFQWIKNDILGPECEAVELYPAESRLNDTCNKFHLYGTRDPTFRFPFGYAARDVDYEGGSTPGTRQRPL